LDAELHPGDPNSHTVPVTAIHNAILYRAMEFNRHLNSDKTTLSAITRVRRMEDWTAAEWQKIEHTFNEYPKGIRFVVFNHAGKDDQYWAGHYGSKMTKASVVVNYGSGNRRESF
uniref:FBA domain-containing protein n=1 Tax=Gongylonema pulchrum TaxID=637853 RepID=A0A183EAT9_9BILA